MNSNLFISQLLSSRICHDLVGAASAINAGIELLNEDQSDIAAPLELMEKSAGQITQRLSFFRLAFGSAGGPDSPVPTAEIRQLADSYFAGGRVSLAWNALAIEHNGPALHSVASKLLLNTLLLAANSLARGGEIRIHAGPLEGGLGIAIEAEGDRAALPDDIRLALSASASERDLTARNVHAYFAAELARTAGGALEAENTDKAVQIACMIPPQ